MELNISDLLDDYRDSSIDIGPFPDASVTRIKELTMQKIHKKEKPCHRGFKTISKIILVAAVLASMALPVMAAGGFHFTQWVEGLFHHNISDFDHDITSGKHWELSGWVLELNAENPTSESLTLNCLDIGIPDKNGTLTAGAVYWMEKWDGEAYQPISEEVYEEETHEIKSLDTVSWEVNWKDTYGSLPSGNYRIGKTFVYTDNSGKAEDVTVYAKFRVFTQEMAPYFEKCREAFDDLQYRDSYHLTYYYYPEEPYFLAFSDEKCVYYTAEYQKDGSNHLRDTRYIKEGDMLLSRKIVLYREGLGYKLDENVEGTGYWETADWVGPENFDLWTSEFSPDFWDTSIGELYADGNKISLIGGRRYDEKTDPTYWELVYTFDDKGTIESIRRYSIPDPQCEESDKHLESTVIVHDTSAAEIARGINAQDVDTPRAFSWEEEKNASGEGVKTEGFVNTTARVITNAQDAIQAAKAECTLENQNSAAVYYDETADMWKVDMGWSQDYTLSQCVYLDGQGITRLIVSHETVNIGG